MTVGRVLDFPDMCKYVGITERYGRRLVAEDRIPITRIGRKLFFNVAEIDRWLTRSTTKPSRGVA